MMIKVIFCTDDTVYAKRLSDYFDKEYGNKIELDICGTIREALDFIHQYRMDVALFDDGLKEEVLKKLKDIPCTCVFMTEQLYESDNEEISSIHKFQRGNRIYKDIIELYSSGEKVKHVDLIRKQDSNQRIYVFTSAGGGSGTSAIAKAFAKRCAAYEKVLYLDLGLFNLAEVVEGSSNGLDEILLALKSRRNILPFKLQSAVSCTADRVFTYGPCSNEVGLLELNDEDARHLIDGITALSEYEKIIIDISAAISIKEIEFIKKADHIIYVMDESDIGKRKFEKFCRFMEGVENKEQMHLNKKILVFRNKVRQNNNIASENYSNRIAGWAPYVSADSYDAVVERIAQSDSFSNLEINHAE